MICVHNTALCEVRIWLQHHKVDMNTMQVTVAKLKAAKQLVIVMCSLFVQKQQNTLQLMPGEVAAMIVCTMFKEYRLHDVGRKQLLSAVKKFLPNLCKEMQLCDLSKEGLAQYAAQGFLDNGVIEIRDELDVTKDIIAREDIMQVRPY